MATEIVLAAEGDGTEHSEVCLCMHCGLDFDFDLPQDLVYAAHARQLVIFAGAGVSTEVPTVFPLTIMQAAAERLELGDTDDLSFPEVMQKFEDKFGRRAFVQLVRAKFDYVDSFRTLRYDARKFHRELATMPYLENIVTTNWDTYFEEECQATPFVTGADIALWNTPGRRVLKIHGSMSNLGSLVATESDYKARLKALHRGIMGALLKELLATHTVVFVGYSLRDWNFRRLYKELRKDMGPFSEKAYFVSPFGADQEDEKKLGLITLKTSGVHFLAKLKEANVGSCFINDSSYAKVDQYYAQINMVEPFAKTVPHKEYPAVLYCWAFHDGARDACARIRLRRGSGEYSSRAHVHRLIHVYERLADAAFDEERFWDHAYIEGYLVPLYIMTDDGEDKDGELLGFFDSAPFYLIYGADSDLRTEAEFREAVIASRRRAPRQRMAARQILADIPADMIMVHAPFIPGLPDENEYVENEHA